MKAISIKQPWASMIASGEKTIETRLWNTSYRGNLLIVSSLNPKINNLPAGQAIAIAEIYDCKPMTLECEKLACCKIYDGAYSWFLKNIITIPPFKVKGQLRLYDVCLPADIHFFLLEKRRKAQCL